MPPVRVTRSNGSSGSAGANGQLPDGAVSPEEAAAIRASVTGKEIAPSSRIQSGVVNWRLAVDQLGNPYEVDRIAISQLRRMRRDPMLGFGLAFTKMPHVRAKWYVNAVGNSGPNAQISAHLDYDLRRIWPSFCLLCLNGLDFGFQAMAKRFELRTPAGTYIETNPDTGEQEEKPIWSEGNVDPIGWKPFVALRPEGVEPIWNNNGEFDGIDYDPASPAMPAGVGAVAQGAGGNNSGSKYPIDLARALWFTVGKEENFGSIYGYPRLAYAFRYWWSYWFRWAIADRAFERKADPSVLVRHPDGEFTDENTGAKMSYAEYALLMGERMRSGGVIALPSEVYEDSNGRGTMRQWEIEFTKDATNFDPFDKSFEYLDVQKLRALFIPEQAFLEGKGGTSSRNVAAEMGDSFIEQQAVLNGQIVEHVNRYLIPQWLAVNYPEFVANENGTATLVMQGFADEDVTFTSQLIQLIGQQETGAAELLKLVDIERLLDSRGTPIADYATQQRRLKEASDAAAAATTPAVTPIPGQSVGTAPSATGFSYIAPREVITLADNGTEFIHHLPNSVHYEDNAVKGFMRRLWNVYKGLYEDEYSAVLAHIADGSEPVTLADDGEAATAAHELVATAPLSPKWPDALNLTGNLLEKIMRRAGRLELKRAALKGRALDADGVQGYLGDRIATYAPIVAETTRTEIRDFMAAQIDEGITDRAELVKLARENFADYPKWKADRLVRTETRDAYNAATLLAADEADVKQVQCLDGNSENPAPDSIQRDGRIYSIADAEKQTEHPNGTLGWRLLPAALTIEHAEDIDGAEFDRETNTLTLANDLEPETERRILKTVVAAL